jgi:hypothetical protein
MQRIWGKKVAIIRIGMILLGRLERNWMAIGIILNIRKPIFVII